MNYSILLFWKIGKKVYEEEKKCENAIKKYADYYSQVGLDIGKGYGKTPDYAK